MEPDLIKRGALAGIVWAVLVVIGSLPYGSPGGTTLLSLEESLFEAAFAGLMSWGVYRRSRVCVSLLLLQIVGASLSAALLLGHLARGLFTLPFLFVVGQAALEIFRHRRNNPPRASNVARFLGLGLGAATVAGFVVLTIVSLQSPPTRVLPGAQVPAAYVSDVIALGLVQPDEKILFFYSPGLFDIREELYLVTDGKLVAYSEQWASPALFVGFDEIAELDVEFSESWPDDSLVVVELLDGSELFVPLSSEGGGDRRFFEKLETLWKQTADQVTAE